MEQPMVCSLPANCGNTSFRGNQPDSAQKRKVRSWQPHDLKWLKRWGQECWRREEAAQGFNGRHLASTSEHTRYSPQLQIQRLPHSETEWRDLSLLPQTNISSKYMQGPERKTAGQQKNSVTARLLSNRTVS